MQVGPPETRRSERLYGKTFAGSRGPRVYAALRAISAARACGPDVWLPEPVAYLGPLKLLLQREVPGRPIGPALLRGDELLARRLADALHELHTSGVTLERRHSLGNEVDPLPSRVERLSEACPALAPAARRCLALVGRAARHPWPWRWRPIPRDFYYDQALVGEHGLAVLDFDDAAMSEPAIDVANFLGHLRLLSLQETSAPDSLAAVADAFTRRYQQLDPDLDPGLLRVLEGATLLRLADIHLPRSRGEWLATRLLDQSESLLRPLSVPGDAITGLPGVSEIRGRIPV